MMCTSHIPVANQPRGATPNRNSNSATTPKSLSDMNISTDNQNNTNAYNLSVVAINNRNMTKLNNHSNDNLDKNLELIELSRITKKKCVCQCCYKYRYSHTQEEIECELHKQGDVYGKESIVRKRVNDEYGGSRRAANLKFKCVRDAQEWTEALRTMGTRMHAVAVMWLLLAMVATCAAAPARPHQRPTRSATESVRSYLQTFGYLKRGVPEVDNLLHGDADSAYDADLKSAITTLQEFGGIPVTGEVDDATMGLMKKKRCGRPDRETDDNEQGKRRKRFVVQGEKWKHTNLTWSMSSVSRPSNLDMHLTRSVLARALDVWEQESRLTFTELNSDTADIVVSFAKRNHGDLYPFDGRGSILAHAFFPGSGRGGDAHFDDDELWLLQPKNDDEEGTSLFAVAAHEFGHSLGLSHSSEKGALMFPWYQGIQPNFVLPEDDRNGIQEMYGPKEKRSWARIPHYPSIETPPPTTTTTTTTTTRRPYIHHHNRHQHNYTPYPRTPGKYPTYYPDRRYYPQVPRNPERPQYPDRRYYNTSEGYPRRPDPHYPRPTETTTHPTTTRPRYPTARPEYPRYKHIYPNNRNQPNYPKQDYPRVKPYYPERTTVRPTPPSDVPNTCDTSYDAVTLIRGELFIFKNRYHWRIGDQGRYKGYPMEITRMWSDLPRDLTHVDAVYERQDKKIAIFIGKQLYLFEARELIRGYPRPIQDLGLPDYVEKLDAAMVWGHNEKTYFYSGDRYWKYDEEVGRVEPDYPRDMSMWKGVGYNIDSVFQWKDGKTYFFKGKGFWKFNDLKMQVEQEAQLSSASFWMACSEVAGRRERLMTLPAPGSTLRSLSAAGAGACARLDKMLLYLTAITLLVKGYARYC